MADVPGKFYRATKVRTGVSPSSPGVIEGETLPPLNPPGGSLNSVGLTMPSAFNVANSPLTSNGTIDVTGAGTTAQYIRGDGSLASFPSLTGFVPYTGATQNVDLGEFGVDAGFVNLDTTPTNTPNTQGTIYWDDSKSTAALIMNGTIQHIGQDTFFYVKNSTGSSIPKGTAVRFAGTDGASGHLLITPFLANGSVPSTYFMGVTAEVIANGAFGQVMHFGELEGINTSGYTAGSLLYASTTVAGGFQTTAPVAPNNIVLIAATINSKNNGAILVRPTYGSNINTDEGVKITSPATGQLLQLQAGGLWENKTLGQVIGGTSSQFLKGDGSLDSTAYVPTSRQVIAGAGLTGGGALTANVTLSHADTSSQSSVDNSNGNVIQDITLDTYGHITALGSTNLDSRYYTESEIDSTLTNYQLLSAKGQPNGYAGLDSNGKVPLAQINDALIGNVNFQGLWNAATNTPTLANPPAAGTKGYYYIVSTAGTFAGISFEVGDWIISNGSAWGKVDNTDAVSSVFGRTGNVTASNGDYNTSQVTESGNLYYTEARVSANTDVAANTAARHAAVTLGTANGLSLNVQQLSLALASGSTTGALSSANWTTFNNKENAITAGTTAQYYRGDKTFQTLNTGVVPESGNLYFTNARAIASVLTGYTSGAGTISAADTILSAIQKLNGNIGGLTTGVSSVFGRTGAVVAANGDYYLGTTAIQAASANQAITGITGITFVAHVNDAASITTTISSTSTFFDFNLADDNLNDEWRWRFTPSGASVYDAMRLVPTTNTTSNLIVSGNIVKSGGTSSQFLKADGSVDSNTYLTGNQTITLSGDATGSGTTAITVTLANSGVTAGTYNNVATQVRPFTVDAKGRITSIGTAVTITPAFSNITGKPTTLAGYGITDAVPSNRTITINGVTQDLSLNRTYDVGTVTSVGLSSTTSGVTIGSTPVTSSGTITLEIATASGLQNGLLSSTDWTTFNNKQANIVAGTTAQYYRGDKTFQTLNTAAVPELTNLYFTTARVLATALTGYVVGANTALAATDTILAAFGKVQGQINAKGSGTVTSVAALTIGTTGTDLSSSVANGTTTPVITLNVPTASAANRGALSAADWTTFNNKENAIAAGTTAQYYRGDKTFQTLNTAAVPELTNLYYTEARVSANTDVAANTAARHAAVTLGTANGLGLTGQELSLGLASSSANGALSSTDWTTFNNKQNALTNPVTGTGAAGQVSFWDGTTTQTGDNGLFWDNTNKRLGIGTNAPDSRIHAFVSSGSIQTLLKLENGSATASSGTKISFTEGGAERAAIISQINTGTTPYLSFENNGAERMRITSSGNVGIGTQTPDSYTGTASTRVLAVGTTSGNNGVNVISGTTSTGSYMFSDSGGNDRGGLIYFHTADLMTLTTAGSERMRIFNDGNVLIQSGGTFTNNGARLQVSGTASISATNGYLYLNAVNSGGNESGIFFQIGGSNKWEQYTAANDSRMVWYSYASSSVVASLSTTGAATFSSSVTSSGTIFANTQLNNTVISPTDATNITNGFNLLGSQSYWGIRTTTAGNFALDVYGAGSTRNALTILQASGNVGIGTTSPNAKLLINGTGDLSYIYNSGASTTDANFYIYNATRDILIVRNSGNVGIGTASPAVKLNIVDTNPLVVGDSTGSLAVTYETGTTAIGQGGGIFLGIPASSGSFFSTYIKSARESADSANSAAALVFGTRVNGGSNTERMRITSSGSVGIGTSSPSDTIGYGRALDVQSSTGAALYLRDSDAPTTQYGFVAYDGNDNGLKFNNENSSGFIRFNTAGTERMRIFSGGNVRIGGSSVGDNGNLLRVDGQVFINANTQFDSKTTTGVASSNVAIANFSNAEGSTYYITATDGTNYYRAILLGIQNSITVVSSLTTGTVPSRSFVISSNILNMSFTSGTWTVKCTQIRTV